MVAEARRQEQFQLAREGQKPEDAAGHARDNTATIEERGKTDGGYVRVDVPTAMLGKDETHVSPERQARLEKIGGTQDPIFIADAPIIQDGKRVLTPINGNNRIAYAESHGIETVPAYVTRKAWAAMQEGSPGEPVGGARESGLFGPVFHEYSGKPADAIAKLQQEQTGEVPRVWHNAELARATNTDGWIGLAWGNLKGGLAHIIDKHVIRQKDLKIEDLAEMIPQMRVTGNDGRSVTLESETHRATVRLSYDDVEKRWLVTAFEKRPPTGESPAGPGSPTNRGGGPGIAPPGGPSGPLAEASGAPGTNIAPEGGEVNLPPRPERPSEADTGVYLGSGLGALEPLFRESKAEGDALLARRRAAIEAIKAARESPEQHKAGEALRAFFTSERDLWAARVNQALDIVRRKVVPKIQTREAIGLMREFRHRPQELQAFIDGTHPFLQEADGGAGNAAVRLEKLQPVMREAMRMMEHPTPQEAKADRLYTNISQKSLDEGQKGGWLGSRWKPDEYVPHLVHKKGEGDVARLPATAVRMQGKIGKYFGFGERRADKYPTVLHAIADGLTPKTLDPSVAFTVHGDRFAQARATHLLQGELAESGMGVWGDGEHVPDGWVQLARHTDEFKQNYAFEDAASGTLRVGRMGLYVPKFIDEALKAVTAPDPLGDYPKWAQVRSAQRGLKEAILGLSGFHLLTENVMAKADIGASAMYRGLKMEREGGQFLLDERDLIAHGGTTSIQGSTMDAYRGLKPGTIPTRGEIIRAYIPGSRQGLELANQITDLTFANVQRRFKVVSFALHRDAWMRENPSARPEQLAEAKRGIASYVNGVYGGLHWENMGWSRLMVEIARGFLLAPDWSGSNIALGKYALDDVPLKQSAAASHQRS